MLDDDDARLARMLHRGDEAAAAEVEARYGRILTGFLRDALPDHGTAEEVRQQVLLEIWRRGPRYDPARSSPLTWVLLIARSRAADERRRRRPEPVDPATVAETHGGRRRLRGLLERWRLAALLDRLSGEEAQMLRMRFYEGLSPDRDRRPHRYPAGDDQAADGHRPGAPARADRGGGGIVTDRELVAAYVLGELDPAELAGFELRLRSEPALRSEVEATRSLSAGLEALTADAWPDGARSEPAAAEAPPLRAPGRAEGAAPAAARAGA